ncbi:unnamed protein product [Ceratitis capitata]|uniref:(Mediterranean fruit fly) hypothetical protein n=1 Tax=Ceratitis capitata TaxID=7213 RepID=A0A811V374_CERCA|nr:unnamed protein product [Ceratitis capitata]
MGCECLSCPKSLIEGEISYQDYLLFTSLDDLISVNGCGVGEHEGRHWKTESAIINEAIVFGSNQHSVAAEVEYSKANRADLPVIDHPSRGDHSFIYNDSSPGFGLEL